MVNAFSFCIYNAYNPMYYTGLIENIDLIKKHFPEFYTYVYVGNDVPDWFIIEMRARPKIIVRFTRETGPRNMIHRFFAIDEPEVDMMFVRDADSRVHWKDRWAIREFLNTPEAKVHIIRDNPAHGTAILGGLWAMRKIDGINVQKLYQEYKTSGAQGHGMGFDQDFLMDVIYPRTIPLQLIHSSHSWRARDTEVLVPFPFTYTNDIYCGRIEAVEYREPTPPQNAFVNKQKTIQTVFSSLPRAVLKLS